MENDFNKKQFIVIACLSIFILFIIGIISKINWPITIMVWTNFYKWDLSPLERANFVALFIDMLFLFALVVYGSIRYCCHTQKTKPIKKVSKKTKKTVKKTGKKRKASSKK